jgi:chemotaxis protein histidine kinase CheA/ActR/RegA family two-component response regulator
MSNSFDRSAIFQSFLDEVGAYLPSIQSRLDRLQQAPHDRESLEEAYRHAHTITGSAGMMGFTGLARVAQGMEETLYAALHGGAPLDAPAIALLRRSHKRLERLVALIKTGSDDASLVAEDDADRAAWRGAAPTGSNGFSEGLGSSGVYAPAASDPHARSGVRQDPWASSRADMETHIAPTISSDAGMESAGLPTQVSEGALQSPLDDLRAESDVIRRQVGALREVVARLRDAAQKMEGERAELRTFLDGSDSALARLEAWVGRQMGLNLEQSADSARRYLPLSVVWVIAMRLKNLVALLHDSSRTLTVSQEQMDETLGELQRAVEAASRFSGAMTQVAGGPQNGFSATVAQFAWQPAPSNSIETLSPGARAELERSVREDLRRSLEDSVRDEIAALVRREEEQRLRHEIEIQVRRQFLSEMGPGGGSGQISQTLPTVHTPREQGPRQVQASSEQSPEMLEVFRDEAQEHLSTITDGIRTLERAPGDVEAINAIRRATHTLKGAAGMMGFTAIQTLSHDSEDLLEQLADGRIAFDAAIMRLILDTADALDQLISRRANTPEEQQALLRSLNGRYASLIGSSSISQDGALDGANGSSPASGANLSNPQAPTRVEMAMNDHPEVNEGPDLNVRLQLSKLDDLVNLFGDILVSRSVVEERMGRLNALIADAVQASNRLREVGGQLETRFEATTLSSGRTNNNLPDLFPRGATSLPFANRSDSTHTSDFDDLEIDRYTEFHRLSRILSESVADIGTLSREMETLARDMHSTVARENRLSSEFQDRLLKARLVPLESLVSRLYRAARGTALAEGKEIEFYVEGADTEVDRKVIEEVETPLLHLVRNAVSHGIENPRAREKAGKPRAGTIILSATYEGNQVAISVRDDGAGIDPNHIRSVAIQRGWVDSSTQLSEREAINLLFQTGVSTAEKVTQQSGRGVGLDVVREIVTQLRGVIEVDSQPGQGSVFTMKFPLTLQIARAVLVRAGPQMVAIPMAVVEEIGRLDYYQRTPGDSQALQAQGARYALTHLAVYLDGKPAPMDDRTPVLLVNAGGRHIALMVDTIVSQQELVRKPLGPHLRDVAGVAGAAALGNGQVVVILELNELLAREPHSQIRAPEPGTRLPGRAETPRASFGPLPGAPLPPQSTGPMRAIDFGRSGTGPMPRVGAQYQPSGPYLLVVDDSPSVRRVVSNMLKANGWEVLTARDGIEALEQIARDRPAAVLLDIEMPRMDGYELMASIRAQEQYRDLPLIALTSRAAGKHRQRAMQLGANEYIIKPYQDQELLAVINRLVQTRAR